MKDRIFTNGSTEPGITGREASRYTCSPLAVFAVNRSGAKATVSDIARLVDLASQLGRLATGIGSSAPPEPRDADQPFLDDIARVYGSRRSPASGASPLQLADPSMIQDSETKLANSSCSNATFVAFRLHFWHR